MGKKLAYLPDEVLKRHLLDAQVQNRTTPTKDSKVEIHFKEGSIHFRRNGGMVGLIIFDPELVADLD